MADVCGALLTLKAPDIMLEWTEEVQDALTLSQVVISLSLVYFTF